MGLKKSRLNIITLLLCTACIMGQAQEFQYEASIDKVASEGFYSLLLDPEVLARANDDVSDLRIYDVKSQEEIPYLLRRESGSFDLSYLKEYPIIENKIFPKKATRVVIHNAHKEALENLCIIARNSDVYKTAKLSGSSDKTIWYVIKDDYHLGSMYSSSTVQTEKTISFPLSDYEYFKLEISDSLSEPLNIQKVGGYATRKIESMYVPVPQPSITQADSHHLKQSYINISYNAPYVIDKLQLHFKGPRFYNRSATLYQIHEHAAGKTYKEEFMRFRVFSNADNVILTNSSRAQSYLLVIDNQDNKALKLTHIKPYVLKTYLIASFKPDADYLLRFGHKNLASPSYDLAYFADSIPAQLVEVRSGKIKNIQTTVPPAPAAQWFTNKLWIWASILVVGSLLAFISVRMVKDMGKTNPQE